MILHKSEKIEGIGFKTNNEIVINKRRHRRLSLDKIPYPDWESFNIKGYHDNRFVGGMYSDRLSIPILATRGCPYQCTYCASAHLWKAYPNPENWVRFPSIERSIRIIKDNLDLYPDTTSIVFADDTFTVRKDWVKEFCAVYKEEIGLPFECNARVETINDNVCEDLKSAGCTSIDFGVESGSEKMLAYMRKGERREHFIEKIPIMHANGMATYTTWVYGLPSETEADRSASDKFIELLKPTFADTFVYLGQPGSDFYKMINSTKTYEFKEKNGLFYVPGFIHLAKRVYGINDPRVEFVENLFEKNKIREEINNNKRLFFRLFFWISLFLFLGTYLQQAALLYTDVANAAFFTIFYVPMVPIILFFIYSKSIHWSIWPSVLFCIAGVYLLSNFSDATIRLGDSLVILCALFWSLHIIFIGNFIKNFNLPLFFGAIQALGVSLFSIVFALLFETITIANILNESVSIIYAGVLSGGIAFTLQIYAQKNISPAPAAIVFSLEGVFATISAWIILNQILGLDNIIGCTLILFGVLFSQLLPIYDSKTKNI